MKRSMILGVGMCVALAFTSCKSSESAYKKAYEQAKQQELANSEQEAPAEVTPVVTAPVEVNRTPVAPEAGVRQEKVTVEAGDELKAYSVVCGSFGLKANAEALKDFLKGQGYGNSVIAFNPAESMYRVVVDSYSDRESAASARDAFKNRYPQRKDFQGSWLLYRLY